MAEAQGDILAEDLEPEFSDLKKSARSSERLGI